ncbi:NADH-quinone oxidoreductase subunit M [Methylomicrobium agile]|uniref:NADH-quinone oxidoreductase subunit M n=1 Tax=Methylomicrobium agile TaxID=39774 RepID=UPI0004DEE239|nr:NADH-quinone oxidoreductase subunit M [Methylomicrobium agile]
MMLSSLIAVLFLGGIAAWTAERWNPSAPRWIAIGTLALEALLAGSQFAGLDASTTLLSTPSLSSAWLAEVDLPWIPRFGIGFHLAADGLSLLLIALTVLLGFMAASSSWTEIDQRTGFFYFNLLTCLAGTVGVFLAVDLFLFFLFWEVMIVPMYFLISIWGHENRIYAAIKFVIFTQVSSLLMLISIIVLALVHYHATGAFTFDYFVLLNARLDPELSIWLMLGFFIAFTVKLPAVPFHTWLPDAHTQAPTGGSVILAGVLLKTGAYGLLRFVIPLFPDAAHRFAPVALALGVVSVLYAALMAFAQSDFKRLVAYTSVSHMGFILLGAFSWNLLAMQGAVVTMLAHGLSAGALFMIAGSLQHRLHSREFGKMGGLWQVIPQLSAFTLFFIMATLGLPGLGNFVGEFLVLIGVFQANTAAAAVAALALILSPVYALIVIQRAYHGPLQTRPLLADCSVRELASLGLLVAALVWLGLHPQAVLDVSKPALQPWVQNLNAKET